VATVTCTPTSPVATVSVCRLDVAEADANRSDHSEFRYYLSFETSGSVELGRSYVFNVSADGTHSFNSYVMPSDTVTKAVLHDAADDSVVVSQNITVTAP
jgi:hypothetical protein